MKRICVFSGSSSGAKSIYSEQAKALAKVLCENDLELVYGGAKVGLMGIIADEVMRLGGTVVGVIPEQLLTLELAHEGISDLRVVQSMHERKSLMEDLSDGFIALPGGVGTLEELFEIFTWGQLGLHRKPFGLLNVSGYYDKLQQFVSHMVEERFLSPENADMIFISDNPTDLMKSFHSYEPVVVPKWIDERQT